eukprot:COSAG02_NODE_60608_length_271_cov_0.412791_1_plen_62_part_10
MGGGVGGGGKWWGDGSQREVSEEATPRNVCDTHSAGTGKSGAERTSKRQLFPWGALRERAVF